MASLLRQIVAGPRARHPEAGIDLCYVTDNIIATSGPSGSYPKRAYRTPLDQLVKYLDKKHKDKWAIWEFRAEGTGYPDSAVYNRIWHFPWPDHHPPPFALIPNIVASMRNWLKEEEGRVVVVHCKAGKGRSGTSSVAYLISEEGWSKEDALKRFTERRMRPGFGAGVSIPSQLRWVGYVERWANNGKTYIERRVQITEVRVYGLRDGVKVSVEGFEDEGKVIKTFHSFSSKEREVVRGDVRERGRLADVVAEMIGRSNSVSRASSIKRSHSKKAKKEDNATSKLSNEISPTNGTKPDPDGVDTPTSVKSESAPGTESPTDAGGDVILRPSKPIILPTSDVNIDFERRTTAAYNLTMVTSVAHVWFNCFFEGNGPENASSGKNGGLPETSGVFELEWDKLDGIKGSARKGTKGFDKFSVSWKALEDGDGSVKGEIIKEPALGETVKQPAPADWQGTEGKVDEGHQKDVGIRIKSPEGSTTSVDAVNDNKAKVLPTITSQAQTSDEGTKPMGKEGENKVHPPQEDEDRQGPTKSKTTPAATVEHDEAKGKNVPEISRVASPESLPGFEPSSRLVSTAAAGSEKLPESIVSSSHDISVAEASSNPEPTVKENGKA